HVCCRTTLATGIVRWGCHYPSGANATIGLRPEHAIPHKWKEKKPCNDSWPAKPDSNPDGLPQPDPGNFSPHSQSCCTFGSLLTVSKLLMNYAHACSIVDLS